MTKKQTNALRLLREMVSRHGRTEYAEGARRRLSLGFMCVQKFKAICKPTRVALSCYLNGSSKPKSGTKGRKPCNR